MAMRALAWVFALLCLTIAGLMVDFSPTGIAPLVIAFIGWVVWGIRQMVRPPTTDEAMYNSTGMAFGTALSKGHEVCRIPSRNGR